MSDHGTSDNSSPNRSFTRIDWLIAGALFVGSVAVLLATVDMGYTRDETFYFRHSSHYARWVSDLFQSETPKKLLDKKSVYRYWHGIGNNMEHPPLMKVAFGFSWRILGQKRRLVSRPQKHKKHGWVVPIYQNGRDLGIDVGTTMDLYRPQPVSGWPEESQRLIGSGIVVQATPRILLKIPGDPLTPKNFSGICGQPLKRGSRVPSTFGGCIAKNTNFGAWLQEDTAMRFPAMLFTALLVVLIFFFGTELMGRGAGVFAALSMLLMPRFFFHAHLTCFDVAITTMVFATQYAFWRSERSKIWALGAAVLWGIALLTKHNSLLVPVGLVLYWLCAHWREYSVGIPPHSLWRPAESGRLRFWRPALAATVSLALLFGATAFAGIKGGAVAAILATIAFGIRFRLPRFPLAFILMPPIGLTILFLGWPALWYDSFNNFYWYLNFHLKHVHYLQFYFGNVLGLPPFPFAFPFVLTFYTVPAVTLVCFGTGSLLFYLPWQTVRNWLARRGETTESSTGDRVISVEPRALWFIAINGLIPILTIAMPSSPVFGGVKHWFPAMPLFCMIAAGGFVWMVRLATRAVNLQPGWQRTAVAAILGALVLLPSFTASVKYSSAGTSYYNELAGGIQGAANKRMHRQFWGYAARGALDWLNKNAPKNARVWFHNSTWGAVDMYKRVGLLRLDVRSTGIAGAQFALYFHQKAFENWLNDVQAAFKSKSPVYQVKIDGVPLVSVYAQPGVLRAGR